MTLTKIYKLFLTSKGVCTDTRKIKHDQLFFALKGDNFNGNKYAKQAIDSGASYAIIDDAAYALDNRFILVLDVLECLQELSGFHRDYLQVPIIGIAGSNGKTTTKELLLAVLSKKYNTYATKGNLNNHIGVPLSLLELTKEHELAIIEMGANHQNEIATYCVWVKPNFGLITNIGKAHMEGFGGIVGIVKGKTELYKALAENQGLVFYNADDSILNEYAQKTKRTYSYAQHIKADLNYTLELTDVYVRVKLGETIIDSQMVGIYNGHNIAAALAIGRYFDVPLSAMKAAIEEFQPDSNRSQMIQYKGNELILDAYNANPTSMMAALENFKIFKADKKAVFLGDMFEVGETSSEEHLYIVNYLKHCAFDFTVLVGRHFYEHRNHDFHFFETMEQAKLWYEKQNFSAYHMLIKGSRGMKMENIIK
jgi:UDP-N-acetylmuramoyl-tripeptide--D-alanyl-D-alanine ligase